MQIVEGTITHLDELALLFNDYRIFYRKATDLEGARSFLNERMKNNDSVLFIAIDEQNRALGFTQLYPLFSSTRMRRMWLLNDLFVTPSYRGKGISKLLIERCKALAMKTNAAGLRLETEISNHIGNRLYPSAGFTLDTKLNFYFWENPVN
ncbi:MAG: GNAT family N-acetyltransferase [Chitinophagales bacterium]|nr:GNAT family N-acetyltransferase [Chitinophagales bacterium]